MDIKERERTESTRRKRRLSVIIFALFFSWLLAFPFEGRALYAITDHYGISARPLIIGAMVSHFAGLLVCRFFVKSIVTAKKLILFSIVFCAAATGVFFFPPSFLWTIALYSSAFLAGACVAAWGYYFKSCTPKEDRIKTIADCLIFSNVLMILINVTAVHISPQSSLVFSIVILGLAFVLGLKLPREDTEIPRGKTSFTNSPANADKLGSLVFLCLFIMVITINSGLMYQAVNPEFVHMPLLTSWYWAVPYICALFIMRNLPRRINRSYILYVAIAMIGFSFIAFLMLGRSWTDYLIINTLMLGACGIYDLFWWSILGEMIEYYKNPAGIIGIGLASNVFGVILGGLIGNAITAANEQIINHTLLALGIVCLTLIMLPPLHSKLIGFLKSHVYLSALSELTAPEQAKRIQGLNITEKFTETESKVTFHLVQGKKYKAIAAEMSVSENTIRSHVKSIYAKAGVTSKAELSNLILNLANSSS